MSRWARMLVVLAAFAGITAVFPRNAEARGPFRIYGGFYFGYAWPYCGFSPYWGPCYGPFVADMGMAAAAGIGAVDLNVKPGEAEVWVDGRYMAPAKQLHGNPRLLWLRQGPHEVVIYKGGYRTFDEKISLQPGQKMDLKVRMEKGESRPPVARPAARGYETD